MHRVPALKSLRKAREKGGKPSEIMAAEIPGEKHGVFIICVLKGKHFWDNRSAQSGRDSESSARRHLLVAQLAEPPGWARARARGGLLCRTPPPPALRFLSPAFTPSSGGGNFRQFGLEQQLFPRLSSVC